MWPGPGYKSAAESLGEPIKEKGSSHLLARLKGINGFYGMHPGMQIGALQAGIIARFVSGGEGAGGCIPTGCVMFWGKSVRRVWG